MVAESACKSVSVGTTCSGWFSLVGQRQGLLVVLAKAVVPADVVGWMTGYLVLCRGCAALIEVPSSKVYDVMSTCACSRCEARLEAEG